MEFLFLALSREILRIKIRVRAVVGNKRLTMVMKDSLGLSCFGSGLIGGTSAVLKLCGFIN